jgi:hypothetical protein
VTRLGRNQNGTSQRLLVGENGPEVFEASANGHVWINSNLRSAIGGRGGDGGGGVKINLNVQTTHFMGEDWVKRDELEAGLTDAERRGPRLGA